MIKTLLFLMILSTSAFALDNDANKMTCSTVANPIPTQYIIRCENTEVICYSLNEQLVCQFKGK